MVYLCDCFQDCSLFLLLGALAVLQIIVVAIGIKIELMQKPGNTKPFTISFYELIFNYF